MISSSLKTSRSPMGEMPTRSVTALDETNLRIGQGDFIALVGPSGCGKSTILKLVGGLIPASRGYVYVAGRELGAEPVRIGMAFQNPTMLPWLKIRDNVMLPLKIVPPFRSEYRAKKNTEFKRSRRGAAGAGRPERLRRQISLAAFRRHAAARLALPRADPRPATAAARRAVRRARPVHPRGVVGDHAGAVDRRGSRP